MTDRRRPRGTGSISQRTRNGLWCGQVDMGFREGRRYRPTVYAQTREECERKLADLIAAGAPPPPPSRPSIGVCARCSERLARADLIADQCGDCFRWGGLTPGGLQLPQRPQSWVRFTCRCGTRRWTRSGETECVTCRCDTNIRATSQRRAARYASARAIGTHTDAEWLFLLAAHGHRCAYCGNDGPLEKDHVVPVSRGGSDLIENIAPACTPCNRRKRDRTLREFAAVRAA